MWCAIRPNARGLSVAQGKGLTHEQARLSATMEAIEAATLERPGRIASQVCSIAEMGRSAQRSIPLHSIGRCKSDSLDLGRSRAWVAGPSLRYDEKCFAPFELIGADMRVATPWDHNAFPMSTVGVGAGFTQDSALRHALLEMIEDDACALLGTFGFSAGTARPIGEVGRMHNGLDLALDCLTKAAIEPRFFALYGRTKTPVVAAFLPQASLSSEGPTCRVAGGYAARPDPYEAALAALLEAVQTRLTDISSARDDILAHELQRGSGLPASCERSRHCHSKPLSPIAGFSSSSREDWDSIARHIHIRNTDEDVECACCAGDHTGIRRCLRRAQFPIRERCTGSTCVTCVARDARPFSLARVSLV